MWVVFGTSKKEQVYKNALTRFCPGCAMDRSFHVRAKSRDVDVYWILEFSLSKEYACECSVCGKGWKLRPDRAEAIIRKAGTKKA